ncbi:MAG TPA: T9SS type A sorting domain-containing protein, partial [Rhodothermales bacterium]|nr:T9SS type A sorting domain-containing protein [Rhodothermales bacterium]
EGAVRLAVYDLLGREVAVLAEGTRPAGAHTARFDSRALAAGAYLVRLDAGGQSATRRLTVVK